jgi:hypothetical protein
MIKQMNIQLYSLWERFIASDFVIFALILIAEGFNSWEGDTLKALQGKVSLQLSLPAAAANLSWG